MRRDALLMLFVGAVAACGGDDGAKIPTAADDPLTDLAYVHPVRPLPPPLVVTYENAVTLSDPQEEATFTLAALDGGEIVEVDPDRRWQLTPLSRYEATVTAPPYYAPRTGTFRTGQARGELRAETVLRQGLPLGRDVVGTLDRARGQWLIGRTSTDPRWRWEYARVRYDASAPLQLTAERLTFSAARPLAPELAPDASVALLHTHDGVVVWDLDGGAALDGDTLGDLDLTSLVWARAGVSVAAAPRRDTGAPVAFTWEGGEVTLLLAGANPPSGATGGWERRLALSGDGTLLAQAEAGHATTYPLGAGATDPVVQPPSFARDAVVLLGASDDTVYELRGPNGGPCQGAPGCELWVNGTLMISGVWGFAASREARSAVVGAWSQADGVRFYRHDPDEVGFESRPEAGALLPLSGDGIGAINVNTQPAPRLTLPGQGLVFRDGQRTHALSAATGERFTLNGTWTPWRRGDGVLLLREAVFQFDTFVDTCPESGTCQLQLLAPTLDEVIETLQFKGGLPFGVDRDRVLVWGCESDAPQCDELRIREVASGKLRVADLTGAPRLGPGDVEAAATTLDAPCALSGGYCVR